LSVLRGAGIERRRVIAYEETSLNVSLPFTGKYGGVELNFKGGSFDGVSLGIGVGLNLPITYTMPLESFLSSYGP
jgi:hypothetical protein